VRRRQQRAANRPAPEELFGPVQPIDGSQLSTDLLQTLQLAVPAVDVPAVAKQSTPGKHGDLWNWLRD